MSPPAATAADAVTARGPQSPPRAVAGPAGIGGIGDGSASGGSASGGGTDCGDTDGGGAAPQVVPTALTPSDVAALLSRPRLEGPDEAVPAVVAEARVADKVTAAASRPDPPPPPKAPPPASRWFVEPLTPDNLFLHRVASVFTTATTPFQQLAVVDTGTYGRALVLDGKIQTATGDEAFYHEPLVHIPAVLHAARGSTAATCGSGGSGDGGSAEGLLPAAPKSALVLGGGDGGSVRELLRWPSMSAVTLVDIDGAVVDACRTHLRSIHGGALDGDPRVRVVIGDAIAYVADGRDTYDLILCDVTDPLEDGPSAALFTREFFVAVAERLSPGGVMAIQAGPSSLVENPRLHPRVMRTLAAVFPHVASFVSYIPTYGSPLGMLIGGDGGTVGRPRKATLYREGGRVCGTSSSRLGATAVALAADGGCAAHPAADCVCNSVSLMSLLLIVCMVALPLCFYTPLYHPLISPPSPQPAYHPPQALR